MVFTSLLVVSALFLGSTLASPVPVAVGGFTPYAPSFSFSHWGGFSSLDHFDDFNGSGDFAHFNFDQVVVKENELVCRTQRVVVIQQRLAVIREMAKRIITELVCDVETQVIAFEQFHAGLGFFNTDLRRVSGHKVGFDHVVAGHFGDIFGGDGSLTTHNLGFAGHEVGKNTVLVGGVNWSDDRSFASVNSAFLAARHAHRISVGPRFSIE